MGSCRLVGPRRVTADEIVEFAAQFDPQPFHVDAGAAEQSRYGGLIASGWHICALVMRMMCDDHLVRSAGLGSPGASALRWKKPLRPGDEICVHATVRDARHSRSSPDVGILLWHWDVRNQRGESIAELETTGLIRCRPLVSNGSA